MKFSVAPESSSVEVLALLDKEFRYTQIVIDRRFDRYTLLVLNALTKAELVRRPENPLPRLLLSLLRSALLLGLVGWWTWPPVWWLFRPLDSRWWLWYLTSSRLVVPWLHAVSSFGWGSCMRSARLGCTRSRRHGGSVSATGVPIRRLGLCDVYLVDVSLFVLHLDRPPLGVLVPPIVVPVCACSVCINVYWDGGIVQVAGGIGGIIPLDVGAVGLLIGRVGLCEPVLAR
jgi:hypothetical protein